MSVPTSTPVSRKTKTEQDWVCKELDRLKASQQGSETKEALYGLGGDVVNTISTNIQDLPEYVENIIYNLTLIYGEKVGEILLGNLTYILANKALQKSTQRLTQILCEFLLTSIDTLLTGGSLTLLSASSKEVQKTKQKLYDKAGSYVYSKIPNVIKDPIPKSISIASRLIGGNISGRIAEHYANEYINRKIAKRVQASIEQVQQQLHENKEDEAASNTMMTTLMQRKLEILYPEALEAYRAEIKSKKAKAEEDRLALENTRQKSLESSWWVTKKLWGVGYAVKDALVQAKEISAQDVLNSSLTKTLTNAVGFAVTGAGLADINRKMGRDILTKKLTFNDLNMIKKDPTHWDMGNHFGKWAVNVTLTAVVYIPLKAAWKISEKSVNAFSDLYNHFKTEDPNSQEYKENQEYKAAVEHFTKVFEKSSQALDTEHKISKEALQAKCKKLKIELEDRMEFTKQQFHTEKLHIKSFGHVYTTEEINELQACVDSVRQGRSDVLSKEEVEMYESVITFFRASKENKGVESLSQEERDLKQEKDLKAHLVKKRRAQTTTVPAVNAQATSSTSNRSLVVQRRVQFETMSQSSLSSTTVTPKAKATPKGK